MSESTTVRVNCLKRVKLALRRHGIGFPGWVQTFIWFSGTVTLIVISILYCFPILIDYMDDDTNVAISTDLIQNEQFQPPQMVMYIPHYILNDKSSLSIISRHLMNNSQECPQCPILKNASWDVWKHYQINQMDFNTTRFSLAAGYIRKMLSTIVSGSNPFPKENQDWMWPLVESAMYFFSWKYNLDRFFIAPNEANGTEVMELIDSEYFNITLKNETHIYNIFQIYLLEILCRTLNLDVWDYLGRKIQTCEDILIKNELQTLIENDTMWFQIPASSIEQNNLTCTIWPVDNINYENSVWTIPDFLEYPGEIWVYSEPMPLFHWEVDSGSFNWPPISSGIINNVNWFVTKITYNVVMKIQETRLGKLSKCYHSNPKICAQKCSKEWAINKCKCIPFTFNKGLKGISSKNLSYCTQLDYINCNLTSFKNFIYQECQRKCSNPCQYTAHTFHISRQDITRYDKMGFTLVLRPILEPFIEFSWITKDHSWDLISNLGGILNLFMGLSGLSICIFIVSCVDFLQKYRRKRAGERNVGNLRAISLWQKMLMRTMESERNTNISRTTEHSPDEIELERRAEELWQEIERMKVEIADTKEFCEYTYDAKL